MMRLIGQVLVLLVTLAVWAVALSLIGLALW
jgi:hypothetical protein